MSIHEESAVLAERAMMGVFNNLVVFDQHVKQNSMQSIVPSWFPKVMRKDYKVGLNLTGGGFDDPDQQFYENYACGAARNYTGYCNPELEKLFDRQSMEANEGKRKRLVWGIETKLADDGARPIIFYNRFAYCWQPQVEDWTILVAVLYLAFPQAKGMMLLAGAIPHDRALPVAAGSSFSRAMGACGISWPNFFPLAISQRH